MDLPSQETLQQLLIRIRNPELSAETHEATADVIRERFPIASCASEYAHVACYGAVADDVASFILRVLYVHGRKSPEAADPKETFRKIMGDARRSRELRTQAFLHLLLLDIDLAERAAHAAMPEMASIVAVERRYPTIRRVDDLEDAPYEEATLKLLFH